MPRVTSELITKSYQQVRDAKNELFEFRKQTQATFDAVAKEREELLEKIRDLEALRNSLNEQLESSVREGARTMRLYTAAVAKAAGVPAPAETPAPVEMLLYCPECGARHIDDGEFETKPHHTHACQECGMCWRPAVVPTVGVRFLPGFKNSGSGTDPEHRVRGE